MQLGDLGKRCELPQLGPAQSPGQKRILEHFSIPETASCDIKVCVFGVRKDKHHNFGFPRFAGPLHCGSAGLQLRHCVQRPDALTVIGNKNVSVLIYYTTHSCRCERTFSFLLGWDCLRVNFRLSYLHGMNKGNELQAG